MKRLPGPQTKYKIDLPLLRRLAETGAIAIQIAFVLGIPERTFNEIIARNPDVRMAIKEGNKNPNKQMENALFRNGIGYEVIEYEEEIKYDKFGNETSRPLKRKIKHIRGDTKAQLAYLYNRWPDRWTNQQTINLRGTLTMRDRTELANKQGREEE